ELRDGGDGNDVVEGEAVPGVRLDAVLDGERGAIAEPLEFDGPLFAHDMGISAGVEFDDRGAEAERRFDLSLGRLDEQADPEAGLFQSVHHWGEISATTP